MITSEILLSVQIFLSHRKFMFRCYDISIYLYILIFIFLTISWTSKSVTSWWELAHGEGFIFEFTFGDITFKFSSFCHEDWLNDRYKRGQYFSGLFWMIFSTGVKFAVKVIATDAIRSVLTVVISWSD